MQPVTMKQMTGQVTYLQPVPTNVAVPQMQETSQQPYVVVISMNSKNQTTMLYANYKRNAARAIGTLQIVMALLLIGLNTGQAFIRYMPWHIGTGWWASVFYILAGSFGIASGSHPNNCTIMTAMFFSIFSCLTLMSIIAQGTLGFIYPCYTFHAYKGTISTSNDECKNKDAAIALTSLFIIFGVCEFIFALVQSILCCHAACCKPALQINGVNYMAANRNGSSYETLYHVSPHTSEQAPNNRNVQLVMNPSSLQQQNGITVHSVAMATRQTMGATGQNAVMATGGQYNKSGDVTNQLDSGMYENVI